MANAAFICPSKFRVQTVQEPEKKAHSRGRAAPPLRLWRRACKVLAEWDSRALQRERLTQLNDHLLADVGLTRERPIVDVQKLFYWLP